MVLRWTEDAVYNLEEYRRYSRKTLVNLEKYLISLIRSINLLLCYPKLGKVILILENYEIRKLIHKEHQILYRIENDVIIILSFVHIKYPIENVLKYIGRKF